MASVHDDISFGKTIHKHVSNSTGCSSTACLLFAERVVSDLTTSWW